MANLMASQSGRVVLPIYSDSFETVAVTINHLLVNGYKPSYKHRNELHVATKNKTSPSPGTGEVIK